MKKKTKKAINRNAARKVAEEKTFGEDNSKLIGIRKRSGLSKGEKLIVDFLVSNEVEFYREFFFKDFKIKGSRKALFFDFYIPKYKLCIEFDGQQHYTKVFKGKKLVNQERNDFLKSAFCKTKGLNLLRIKYTDIDNISKLITDKIDKIDPI